MIIMHHTPASDAEWELLARGLVKAHMQLKGWTYQNLRDALARLGRDEAEPSVRMRVGRGRFSAIFFLQCLTAMDVKEVFLPTAPPTSERTG